MTTMVPLPIAATAAADGPDRRAIAGNAAPATETAPAIVPAVLAVQAGVPPLAAIAAVRTSQLAMNTTANPQTNEPSISMTAKLAIRRKIRRVSGMARISSILALSVLVFTGCFVCRHDIDPQYRRATFSQLHTDGTPQLVNIDVEYRLYGRNWKSIARRLRPKVVRALTSTHSFIEADESNRHAAGQLLIVLTPDETPKLVAESIAKGIVTGATYGLVSTTIRRDFDMTVTYTPPNGLQTVRDYRHSVETTTGVKAMSETEYTVTANDLADRVMEDMLVNFMYDIQSSPERMNLGPAISPQVAATSRGTSIARLPSTVTSPISGALPPVRTASETLSSPTIYR